MCTYRVARVHPMEVVEALGYTLTPQDPKPLILLQVLSAVEFCDRSAIDFVQLGCSHSQVQHFFGLRIAHLYPELSLRVQGSK